MSDHTAHPAKRGYIQELQQIEAWQMLLVKLGRNEGSLLLMPSCLIMGWSSSLSQRHRVGIPNQL